MGMCDGIDDVVTMSVMIAGRPPNQLVPLGSRM